MNGTDARPDRAFSRRNMLAGGLFVGGAVIGAAAGAGVATAANESSARPEPSTVEPFYGRYQSGIITDTQQHTVLAAFDLNTDDRGHVIEVLRRWSDLAAQLTQGKSATIPIYDPPDAAGAYADSTAKSTDSDSLEAWQAGPNRLTVTIGFGRSMFLRNGVNRFGLADKLPPALVELPRFPGDQLANDQSDGDLLIHACGDDLQVVFHAVRSLARISPDIAALRWTQIGYSPNNAAGTPRNLMGFKDGTINSNAHPPADLGTTLWAGNDGPAWMRDGSFLVYRRIRITLEHWDRLPVAAQEKVVGREKVSGSPLGSNSEFDPLDLQARTDTGALHIPETAHVRLAAPETNNGAVLIRRAFSYNNGTTQFTERWPPWRQALEYDAGLLFLGYQRDPRTAFVPINSRLAVSDALNQFTTHTASAVFALPAGAPEPGHWVGESLFT
jgi:deferrochelatase/peroxidase EfeB